VPLELCVICCDLNHAELDDRPVARDVDLDELVRRTEG
jgi:hypothetical protein